MPRLAGRWTVTVAGMADAMVMDGFFASWNATLDDMQRAALGADVMSPDFSSAAGSIMNSAVDSTSEVCMALTCDYGPWMVAAWGEPSSVITPLRADFLGYGTTDAAEMALMDWAVYVERIHDANQWRGIPPELATDNAHRVEVLTGYSSPADHLEYFLFGTNDTDTRQYASRHLSGIPSWSGTVIIAPNRKPARLHGLHPGIQHPWYPNHARCCRMVIRLATGNTYFLMRVVNPAASGTMDADTWGSPSEAKSPPGRQHRSWSQQSIGSRRGGIVFLDKVDEILYDGPYVPNSDIATMFMYGELSGNPSP